MPGHTRRPNPNGIVNSLTTFPFQLPPTGLCGLRNREGLNVSGSSNREGSLTSALSTYNSQLVWSPLENGLGDDILNVTIDRRACRDIVACVNVALACCVGNRGEWPAEQPGATFSVQSFLSA